MERTELLKITSSLQGALLAQKDISAGGSGASARLARYFRELPRDVWRRLTELPGEEFLKSATVYSAQEEGARYAAAALCTPKVREQLLRAANTYRERLGFMPLNDEGGCKDE